MRHLLSQLCRQNGKKILTSLSQLVTLLPLVLPPAQIGPNSARPFLYALMVLIVLLFIAVAVILPLALRLTRPRPKKSLPTSTGASPAAVMATTTAPSAADEGETTPSMPVQAEDVAVTTPSLRTIAVEREPDTLPASGQRPANIGWKIAGLSDTGLRRELNEDSMVMLEADAPCGLYVVADGMGGHEAGEIASGLTVQTIQHHFMENPPSPTGPVDEWLKSAVAAANEAVLAQQGSRTEDRKMGSTLVMALVMDGQAHIANVGDSRAYIVNSTSIRQISVDHSLVERLVQIGQLTREEARTHKQKNVIYSTVGDKEDMEIGLYHVKLQPGDRLLLCSDGLSGMLTDEEIQVISRNRPEPASACKSLIEAAKMAGGHDNITTIIVQMDQG